MNSKASYDVIVVGGGIAGVAASVAAIRKGASVLLIEKGFNLGGLATGGLISWYEPLCDGEGHQVIHGIAEELIKLSVKYGFENLPENWGGDGRCKPRNERYSTFYSPEIFSAALDDYVTGHGVNLLFDTLATYPVMDEGYCKGVIVENINGREYYETKVAIDATGTAVIMHRAGVPTVEGKNYMTYIAHWYDMEMVEKLNKDGDVCAFRKWMNTGSDMFGNGHPEGMELISGVTAEEITRYMIEGKKSLLRRISHKDNQRFDVMSVPDRPQLRTIRRIVGKCDFNAIDGEKYTESIGDCGDFRPSGKGKHYQIPFGALYNEKFENLLAAGRIISAPRGDGWEVARVIPVCALTGEMAGKAAALCAKNQCSVNEVFKFIK